MLQSGMRRLFCFLLLCTCLHGWAQPVRGVIVQLKAAPANSAARESPQAATEREHGRMAGVAREAGVKHLRHAGVGSPGHHLLRLPEAQQGEALQATLRRLRLHPDVLAVEPDVLLKPLAVVPNDPSFAGQWHLQTAYTGTMNAQAAWARTTGTAAITVAVLDTGIRPHPDLAGRYWPGYDFVSEVDIANDGDGRDADPTDPGDWITSADLRNPVFSGCSVRASSWHGTFIASLIAANSNNGVGVAGVNWNAKILPVRVSGKCGAPLSDILDAMRWSAGLPVAGVPANPNRAQVINLSFGGDAPCSAAYQDVIDEVTAAGTLVVVAAGNDGSTAKRPADCAKVMAVGATIQSGTKAPYSNVGPTLALMAPGGITGGSASFPITATAILSASNSGTTASVADIYGTKQGTSFSAPLAAGVASLMLAVNPSLSPAQLVARMKAGVRAHGFNPFAPTCNSFGSANECNCTVAVCGAGLLDADLAVQQALSPAAVIAAVPAAPLPSTSVALDGRASAATAGASIVSYAWTQTAGSANTLLNANAALAQAALPGTAGTYVYTLKVTDSQGRTGEDTVTVTSVAPVVLTVPSAATSGGGGGALDWFWAGCLGVLALCCYLKRSDSQKT